MSHAVPKTSLGPHEAENAAEPDEDVPSTTGSSSGTDLPDGLPGPEIELARLTTIVESTSDAIVGATLDGTITDWNPAAERLYGYAAAEVRSRSIAILVADGELDEGPGFLARVAEGERIDEHPTRHRTKDGTVLDVLLSIAPVYGTEDRVVGASSIVRDVTERARAQATLQQTEERFRALMDNQPTIAFIKDDAGRYVYVNRPFQRVFRRTAGEMQGKTDEDWLPPEAARHVRENDRAVLAANAPIQIVESAPLPDGRPRTWLSVKFPIPDAEGRRFVGGVSIDITERHRAEELRQMQSRHAALRAEVSAALAERGTPGALLWRCAEAIRDGLGAARVTIWLLDDAEQMLELQASVGGAALPSNGTERVPVGSFRVGRVA